MTFASFSVVVAYVQSLSDSFALICRFDDSARLFVASSSSAVQLVIGRTEEVMLWSSIKPDRDPSHCQLLSLGVA